MATLVDQFGTAISSTTLYKTPSQRLGDFRPVAKPRAKTYEALTAYQRREQVDVSRVIAAGVPSIDAALMQANEFSVGDSWHIKSRSANKDWGKKRDQWFNETYSRDCNARGPQGDWRSSLRQLNWTRKVEGDYGVVFDGQPSRDAASGKEIAPTGRFYILKYDRIATSLSYNGKNAISVGNGLELPSEVGKSKGYTLDSIASNPSGMFIIDDGGPFAGNRICDGVILDANMRVLGYRVVGFNSAGDPSYVDLSRHQLHFNFSARRQVDLIRGIPELAESIIQIMGLDDIQYLITMAIKASSALALYRESLDGNPRHAGRRTGEEDAVDLDGNAITQKIAVQDIAPGILELATQNEEKLGVLGFNRPSMNEEQFIARIETSVLHKLWPRSLIYGGDVGRAGARAIGAQANGICVWDQLCLDRTARFIADRATEFAMRAGYIPANNNLDDAYRYVFTVPGKFTVDEGNDAKMRLSALGRCTISRGMISELDGYLAEEIEEQREAEEDRLAQAAVRLKAKHPWMTEKDWLLRLDHGDSNVSFSESVAPALEKPEPEDDDDSPTTKEAKP